MDSKGIKFSEYYSLFSGVDIREGGITFRQQRVFFIILLLSMARTDKSEKSICRLKTDNTPLSVVEDKHV